MKHTIYILVFFVICFSSWAYAQRIESSSIRYLALGDSYTIGEGVKESERWPNQLAAELNKSGITTTELTNIAQTGWTTGNLLSYVGVNNPDADYDLVSLLIGVNNQFQGRSIDVYRVEFRRLLELAVMKCGGNKEGVFVLSIPDYGYTPFGLSDQDRISDEIDAFNAVNFQISVEMGIAYFNITPISREAINKPTYLARDNLHPSGEMYAQWVDLIMRELEIDIITSASPGAIGIEKPIVYPNPAQDVLHFRLPDETRALEIYNLQGMRITVPFTGKEQERSIDISSWSKGVYSYELVSETGSIFRGKVMKY